MRKLNPLFFVYSRILNHMENLDDGLLMIYANVVNDSALCMNYILTDVEKGFTYSNVQKGSIHMILLGTDLMAFNLN